MSIIRFGISQSVLVLRIPIIFVFSLCPRSSIRFVVSIFAFSLLISLSSKAALEISVTTRDGNPAAGVKIQVFKGNIEPNSDVEPISPPSPRADGLVGFETNSDGKVSVNVPLGEYTVVASSSRTAYKFILMKRVAAPGIVNLSAADGAPVTVTAWDAKGEPLVAANIFFRPCKRCWGLVGQIDNDGTLKAYVTIEQSSSTADFLPGMYHVVLNSAFGLQYLVLANQRIAGAGDEINFDIAELPTAEVIFDLPKRAFPAIYEVLETELTYEYIEKIEEVIGYDAAYTNVYSLIGSGPVTLTAGLTYHLNMSYVVPFKGAFYAYELRPKPLLLSEGAYHIGNTGSESFRAAIFLDKPEYHPEDTVHISYQLIDTRNNRMTRYFDYSGARLIFPYVTVRNPDGVIIASNPNTFDFFNFDFNLPNSARLGEYQVEVSMNAQMYGWISNVTTFKVTSRPDVSPPQISQVTAPTKAEAGSEIILKANIKDDRLLSNVSLNLSHEGKRARGQEGKRAIFNQSINLQSSIFNLQSISPWSQSDNQYIFKIPAKFAIPGRLSWEISATDSAGNETTQTGEPISITDTSPPSIEHEPIETAEIGVDLKIEAKIMDNVDITDAILSYWLNDGTLQTMPMEGWKDGRMEGTAVFRPSAKVPASEIKEFGTLNYFIQATDSTGNIAYVPLRTKDDNPLTPFSKGDEPSFIVAQVVDTIPPTIYHAPVKETDAGVPILIDALVSDNHAVSVKDVKLNYKSTREQNFNVVQMKPSDNLYSVLIPAVTEAGIEYFIEAADEPDKQGQSRKVRAPVEGESYFIAIKPSPDKVLSKLEILPDSTPDAPLELEAGTIHPFTLKAYDKTGKPMAVKPLWSVTGGIGVISQQGVFSAARYIGEERRGTIIATIWSAEVSASALRQQRLTHSTSDIWSAEVSASALRQQRLTHSTSDIWSAEVSASAPASAETDALHNEKGILWQAITEIKIKPSAPQRIALMPRFARLSAGEQQYFYVAVMDAYDNEIPIDANELSWNVSSDIGSIKSAGADQPKSAQSENQRLLFPINKGGQGVVFTASKMFASLTDAFGLRGRGVVEVKWQDAKELTAVSEVQVEFGGLARIAISPISARIVAGQTQTFTISGFDSQNNSISIAPIWSVRGGIGTIQPDGRFTAGLAGDGAIVATLGDLVANAPVTVTEGELSRITIDPFIDYLPISTAKANNYRQFVAYGWDVADNPVPLGNLTWQTDKAAGTIDNTGLFTATTERGMAVGNIVINGSVFANGKSSTGKNLSAKSVVVIQSRPPNSPERLALFMENFGSELPKITMAVGEKQKFEVTGFDMSNQRMRAGGGVPKFSVLGDIGFISPDGIFTATKGGVGEILAMDSGLTARVTIEVTEGTLKSIAIKPEFLTMEAGESYQFTAFGFDQFDNAVPLDDIQWSIDAQGYSVPPASVAMTEKVTAKYTGACQLIAQVGNIKGYAQIFVQPGKLHNLQLFILDSVGQTFLSAKAPLQLTSGTQIQFVAKGYDIAGNELTVTPDWSVSNRKPLASVSLANMIGRIIFDGNFTAIKAGEGVITARQGFISASVKVQVTPGELHNIEVYPNPLNLHKPASGVGELISNANPTQQFRAEGYDVAGNLICQPITMLSWYVVGNLGIIDDTSLFQAREGAKGSGYIVATPATSHPTSDGVAYISVTDFKSEKIKELIIVPNTSSLRESVSPYESAPGEILTLRVGEKQKFYALGTTDITREAFPVLAVWNVTNSVGYIDAHGNLTPTAVGSGTVTATLGGISVDCPILVIPSEESHERALSPFPFPLSPFPFAGGISEIITIPNTIHAKAGDAIRISAVGKDSSGNLIAINPSWRLESSTANLGSVSSNGLFIGNKPGTGRLIVSASGVSTEIPVEVNPNRPTFALIQPETLIFSARNRTPIQFEFIMFDSRGNQTIHQSPITNHLKSGDFSHSPIQWKAIGDIGTIDSEGTFTPSSSSEERHGEVIAFVPELNLLARSSVTLYGYDSSLKEVRIEPEMNNLIRGTTYRFRATVFDSMDRIVDIPIKWQVFKSNSEIVGGITPDGVFTVPKEKTDIGEQFRVVASVESPNRVFQSEALVTMITGPLDTIEIEVQSGEIPPAPLLIKGEIQLKVGETAVFSALGRDAYGNPKEIRPTWRVIGDIGTIPQPKEDGGEVVTFTAMSEGIGTIIAIQGGIVGKAEISVILKEPSVGELDISVVGAGVSASPYSDEVGDVGQTPDNPLQIQSGGSVSFIAHDRHKTASVVGVLITKEILSLNWSIISESSIGIISADGQFIARQVGEGSIQAIIENPKRTAEFFIRVIPGELASIQVTPAVVSVLTKDTQQFSAEGYDASGNLWSAEVSASALASAETDALQIRWNVTGGIGTIDSSGMFTPTSFPPLPKGGQGGFSLKTSIQGTVVASVSDICSPIVGTPSGIGIYGSASVTVVSELGPLSAISMTAEPITVEAGGVSVISIFGADADGNPISSTDFPAPITFTLTPDVGQIIPNSEFRIPNSEFRYRAPEKLPLESERQITITAATTVDGKILTAEISLALKPAQLAQVQLQPKSVTLKAGDTQQFRLTTSDAFGNPTPVNSNWQLSKSLGSLSNQQSDSVTYTATSAGEVELSVLVSGVGDTANPIRATATIIVQPNEPTSLRIEPDTVIIVSGEKREFQVIGVDAYNNEINDLKIDWHIDGDIAVGSLEPIADKPASQIFSAAAVGNITIVAKFQSISTLARIQVIHGELSSLEILLVAKLVSGWKDVEHATGLLDGKEGMEEWKDGRMEERNNQPFVHQDKLRVLLHQLISGGKYIFRAIGHDEHKNEFSPQVRWILTGDVGQIETNADDSSLVLYQATFVEKGRLLATSPIPSGFSTGTVSAEVAIEIVPVSQKIGKQGGRIDSPAHTSLIIPSGALKNETEISIAIIPGARGQGGKGETLPFSFLPFSFDFQPKGLIFKKPAQLSISYASEFGIRNSEFGIKGKTIDEMKLSLYFWDSFQEKWIRVGGKVDITEKTVTASVNHLAPYTIMESKTAPPASKKLDISDIKLTPQVFYAPETNRLTIEYNLAVGSTEKVENPDEIGAEVTINIYDILGRLIATPLDSVPRYAGKNAEQWDGIDKNDRTVRNGRYIVVIIAKAGGDMVAEKKLLVVFK